MNPLKSLYNRLPENARSTIRAWIPDPVLRWYAHQGTDFYLISYPKCGRTWLRLMIGKAVTTHFSLPENEDTLLIRWKGRPHPQIPHITVIHDDRPMLKAPAELENSKLRYRDKQIIFLARDPRDVIVSSYFEMKNRGRLFGKNPYEERQPVFTGSLGEFVHREQGGFDTILRYYNIWAENKDLMRGFLLIRYEDMQADPLSELRRTIDFIGLEEIPDETLAQAVAFASFENMRKMEAGGKFRNEILKPADQNDHESFKTRKGKVKGYFDYLDDKEISNLNRQIKETLSPLFGYPV
jgi:hypothetical protein